VCHKFNTNNNLMLSGDGIFLFNYHYVLKELVLQVWFHTLVLKDLNQFLITV